MSTSEVAGQDIESPVGVLLDSPGSLTRVYRDLMATHSSVLAWRIPGVGEPGGLPSMGSHKDGHN